VRRFSEEYLSHTRRGLWDDREALGPVLSGPPDRILDVGAGTGEFTTILREESDATVVALDGDRTLLQAGDLPTAIQGDALRLPFTDDSFDLVVCQALLVNLPDPGAALEEFKRVATDRVAAVEPDNGAVTVESTVEAEAALAERARSYYGEGLATDANFGGNLEATLRSVGLTGVSVMRMDHERVVEPPYEASAIESARRKITASRLDEQRATMIAGGLTDREYGRLRDDWQSMGRSVAAQIREGTYRRREVVPFYIGVGRVPGD